MKGKLFVIEGSDGSGKATQSKLLYDRLLKEGYPVHLVSFPNYESLSSAPIKMYLNGEIGGVYNSNIYAVSTFYAVDRYISYEQHWKELYEKGDIIICDRYTTSNMIHQAAKIEDNEEKRLYCQWLMELEYEKYRLPSPNRVFFLDVEPEITEKLRASRNNKITNKQELDIHEKDQSYMRKSYENSIFIAKEYGWDRVDCTKNGTLKKQEEIHEALYETIKLNIL